PRFSFLARATLRLGPPPDAAGAVVPLAPFGGGPPSFRSHTGNSDGTLPPAVPVRRRGAGRDSKCDRARLVVYGPDASRRRLSTLLGCLRAPSLLAQPSVPRRDRAVPPLSRVSIASGEDSPQLGCGLRGSSLSRLR